MLNCDVPVVQFCLTVMCQFYNYEQLWCASCTIMINCDVFVQFWSTAMYQLYILNSCTSLTILILLGTRNKLVIRKENVTSKIVRLMKINLEGWITLRTNCKQLKSCNLMVFFWKCFMLTNNTDDNSIDRNLPAAMLFDLKMLFQH